MTDDFDVEADFDDPSHEPIRALLRGARADEPIPGEVADRLDAVLAELRGSMSADDETGVIVPLRRRARTPRLLLAAAAVLAVSAGGVGVAQIVHHQNSSTPASAASGTANSQSLATTSSPQVPPPAVPNTKSLSQGSTPSPQRAGLEGLSATTAQNYQAPVAAFTTAGFAREAKAFPGTGTDYLSTRAPTYDAASGAPTSGSGSGAGAPAPTKSAQVVCALPDVPNSSLTPILLDGRRATLALHPVVAGEQLVEAWSCDGKRVLASATVPR